MPRQQLQDALKALHEELDAGDSLGTDDRKALLDAAQEIQEALAQSGSESTEADPLSRRVSALIEDFETSHPRFAEILGSVSEALANLGI
jgi:hypothetical protein